LDSISPAGLKWQGLGRPVEILYATEHSTQRSRAVSRSSISEMDSRYNKATPFAIRTMPRSLRVQSACRYVAITRRHKLPCSRTRTSNLLQRPIAV